MPPAGGADTSPIGSDDQKMATTKGKHLEKCRSGPTQHRQKKTTVNFSFILPHQHKTRTGGESRRGVF